MKDSLRIIGFAFSRNYKIENTLILLSQDNHWTARNAEDSVVLSSEKLGEFLEKVTKWFGGNVHINLEINP